MPQAPQDKRTVVSGVQKMTPSEAFVETMVANGVTKARLPANNQIICTLDDPATVRLAQELGTTRTAAAMELWRPHLKGAVVAIGNAPTSLFRLLELFDAGVDLPAAVRALLTTAPQAKAEAGASRWWPHFELGPYIDSTVGTEYGLADYAAGLDVGARAGCGGVG